MLFKNIFNIGIRINNVYYNNYIDVYLVKDNIDIESNHYLTYKEYINNFCQFVSNEESSFLETIYNTNTMYYKLLKYTKVIHLLIAKYKHNSDIFKTEISIENMHKILKIIYDFKKIELQKIIHSEDVCNYILEYLIDFKKYDKFINEISDKILYKLPLSDVNNYNCNYSRKNIIGTNNLNEQIYIESYYNYDDTYLTLQPSLLELNHMKYDLMTIFFIRYYNYIKIDVIESLIKNSNYIINYYLNNNSGKIINLHKNNLFMICRKYNTLNHYNDLRYLDKYTVKMGQIIINF